MAQSPRMRRWHTQIVNELRNQYILSKEPSIRELNKCGHSTVATLLDMTNAILSATPIATPTVAQDREIVPLRSPRASISAPTSPKEEVKELAPSMSLPAAIEQLGLLRHSSRLAFHSVHHTQVATCWRRLFTDASILIVLAYLQDEVRGTDVDYKRYIGILDEAIVIANAPGAGRTDMCHDAIARIQDEYLPLTDVNMPSTSRLSISNPSDGYPSSFEDNSTPQDVRISKRPKRATRGAVALNGNANTGQPTTPLPSTSCRQVERHVDPPSLMDYKSVSFQSPFIASRYAADWPACSTWGNPQYLRMVGGLGRQVPVETSRSGEDYTSDQWSTSLMDWEEFLDHLWQRSSFGARAKARAQAMALASTVSRPATPVDPTVPRKRGRPPGSKVTQVAPVPVPVEEWTGPTHYLAQHDLINQFPELRSDIIIPDYVYSVPPAPRWFPTYRPPRVDGEYIVNTWIGPKGCITPAHQDPYYNCYGIHSCLFTFDDSHQLIQVPVVQVIGKKTVWLAPADFEEEMYPYGGARASNNRVSLSRQNSELTNGISSSSSSPGHSTASDVSSSSSASASVFQTSPPSRVSSRKTSVMPTPDMPGLGNTSSVPVFDMGPNILGDFPLFGEKVVRHALSAVLEPGDMLVIPPGWWHAMRSEETSASVSIWF